MANASNGLEKEIMRIAIANEVAVVAQGICGETVQKYLDGELKSTESICTEHEHKGHCNY